MPFNTNDWARLKRIAEGNPDETKIGAFGVGFYSVFSDCEEPFVSSGKDAIAFYWKGNALYTRRLQLDESDHSPDTTFVLDYRNTTTSVPALRPLCEFLASSLAFVGLQSIELWLDDWNLLKLTKKLSPSTTIRVPKDVGATTEEGLMKVTSVAREMAQVDAVCMKAVEWKSPAASSRFDMVRNGDTTASLKSFFSRLTGAPSKKHADESSDGERHASPREDLTSTNKSSAFLHSTTACITTSVGQSFSRELERATKKAPPKNTKMSLLTSSYIDRGQGSQSKDILTSILPAKTGRIYIGFATHQTTGLNAHISAPSVIPTVERESIDLNARWIRTWNLELLRVAGIIGRIAWSAEMESVKGKLSLGLKNAGRSKLSMDDIKTVLPEAIHISNQFVFHESTPAAQVGQVIESSFWTCSRNAYLEVLSTCGVLPSHQVRIAPRDLSFMNGIPSLPEEYADGAKEFVRRLTDFGLITEITVSDIIKELEMNTISAKQLGEFISWIANKAATGQVDRSTVNTLLRVAVAEGEGTEAHPVGLIVVRDIKSYLNPNRIPDGFPLPPFVMPFQYTKTLRMDRLNALGWEELQVDAWVQWLVEDHVNFNEQHDVTRAPAFAARVLPVLSKQWDSVSPPRKETLQGLLRAHTVIPTKFGMRKPGEAYFQSVRLFDDLPVISGLNNVKEKLLVTLGVRKTVELNVIFDRLLDNSVTPATDEKSGRQKWSHVELIKYLASVRNDIPDEDITKLKRTKICTAETTEGSKAVTARHCASELYEPKDSLRELGFPLLYWPGIYPANSAEGQFLTVLGLKPFPSVGELLNLMAQGQSEKGNSIGDKTRKYFISEYAKNGYMNYDYAKVNMACLPVEDGSLSTPSHCFTDSGASLFGFHVLRKDLHIHGSKFGVREHPPINDCVNLLLAKPPETKTHAKTLFEYFSKRLPEINPSLAQRIGQAHIVPTRQKLPDDANNNRLGSKPSGIRYVTPRECYLGTNEDYEEIFDFVDFGDQGNRFLLACGSKQEPTNIELAGILVKEPARVSASLRTAERYLKLLTSIAGNLSSIRKDKNLDKEMKRAPFLLASREVVSKSKSIAADDKADDKVDDDTYEEENQAIKEWQLVRASDAVIVDDYTSFNLFKESLLAAPQEEGLEDMYKTLGTPCLSSLVEEHARCGALAPDQSAAASLQKRIYERSRLFLHEFQPNQISHDAVWLEKHLSVQVVSSISLCRSLRGRNLSHVEKRSAVVIRKAAGWLLYISGSRINFYEVSQALVQLMLSKVKLNHTLTLEMLLKTDLLDLRTRGYNVERILKRKDAEAKMQESNRQQQLEAEKRQANATELAQKQNQDLLHPMPGVFPESPAHDSSSGTSNTQMADTPGKSLFSSLKKRFGLDEFHHPEQTPHLNQTESSSADAPDREQPKPSSSGGEPPPPYSSEDPKTPKPTDPSSVTSPQTLRTNLLSAVRSCRPHGSSTLYSRGEKTQVAETKTYCDERPSQDLVFVGGLSCGIKVFLPQSDPNQSTFLNCHLTELNTFAEMLKSVASVFSVGVDVVSIFHDHSGRTIAFNSRGSIFCNYHYFQQLHLSRMRERGGGDALVYWWVIFCHELAHNLVSEHNSDHSYYT